MASAGVGRRETAQVIELSDEEEETSRTTHARRLSNGKRTPDKDRYSSQSDSQDDVEGVDAPDEDYSDSESMLLDIINTEEVGALSDGECSFALSK